MLPASLYSTVYLIVLSLLTIFFATRYAYYDDNKILYPTKPSSRYGIIIPIVVILFIGFRPLSGRYFVDMINYDESYYAFYYGTNFTWDWSSQNYIIDNIFAWLGSQYYDIRVFFVSCSIVYFGAVYIAIVRFFKTNSLYSFLCFLGAFSTFSYATNGLKAGVAASLFILAISFYKKPILMVILAWLSLGCHHAMILPICSLVCTVIYKNPRVYLIFWILCFFVALSHITYFQEYLAGVGAEDEQNSYLASVDEDWGGKTGFRLDFVLYSVVPIITGFFWYVKRQIKDNLYSVIYNTYILSNAIWMLCMYASFTNRIAYLSWFLYPIVLVYPLFKMDLYHKQGVVVNIAILGQLAFTLFMTFIYE